MASVDLFLEGLGECKLDGVCGDLVFENGQLKGHLRVKRGSVAERYYYEFKDEDGICHTVPFGTSTDPRVIRFKQFKYNEVLRSILKKIQLYRRNGYDLGKNLLIIGDSYGGWIDSEQIVKTIELIMA